MKPEISVLTPAHNAAKYLPEAVESILAQTFGNFEFIILDDASTDETWQIIKAYEKKDERIISLKNSVQLKITKSRNRLLKTASAKYIAWQDADDIASVSRLEKQHAFLEKQPEVGIVGCALEFFGSQGSLYIRRYAKTDKELRKKIFRQSPVAQPAAMIRKEALDTAGLFDETLNQAEDLDLTFRIGRNYKFANLQEPLLKYRFHPTSISNQKIRENIKETLVVRKKAVKLYGYKMGALDYLAWILSWAVQFIPSRAIVKLFELLRS
jgi:glycosyltransferase involved in cell wall biosynthesis